MAINDFNSKQGTPGNTGSNELLENKLGVLRYLVLTPESGEFATVADALDIGNWETNFKADQNDRWYPFPAIDKFEDKSTEDVYDDAYLSGTRFVENGKRQYTVMCDVNKYLALNLRGHNTGIKMRLFEIDESASIGGTSPDGTKFRGCQVLVRVGNQLPAAAGEKVMTPITITHVDSSEWNDEGGIIEPINASPDWNPITDFDGVYDVNLAQVGTATASEITVSVYKKSIATSNSKADVNGLVVGDFVAKDSVGITVSITSSTPNGDGTYTLASSAAFENGGSINLVACGIISLTNIKIESTGVATIVI